MCGASSQQTETYNEQQQFYQQAMEQQSEAWGQDQEILSAMKGVYGPIFAAGPSQEGFAPEEKAALNTQVTEGTAQSYKNASTAVNEKLATLGGGNLALPNGATAQIQAQVAEAAAQTESQQRSQITEADYNQGYQNWLQASTGLTGVSNALNPVAYSGAATSAGGQAANTANQIASENNSWINAALGAAGAIGTGVIGENPGGIFGA
jgi:hypothetical protein